MRQDGIHAQRDGQRSQFLTREAHQILGAGEVGGGFRPIKEAGATGVHKHQCALAAGAVPMRVTEGGRRCKQQGRGPSRQEVLGSRVAEILRRGQGADKRAGSA
jgi:hypothetical protein